MKLFFFFLIFVHFLRPSSFIVIALKIVTIIQIPFMKES